MLHELQRCIETNTSFSEMMICCCRSCRLAPLIQCDYCPLLFHMDCLDPPLTAMPTGRWMCPNHIEHLVVSLLRSKTGFHSNGKNANAIELHLPKIVKQ